MEKQRITIHWFIPRMAAAAGLGQAKVRSEGLHLGLQRASRVLSIRPYLQLSQTA